MTLTPTNQRLFSSVVHALFTDGFICEQSHEAGFKYLHNPVLFEDMDEFLGRIEYKLRATRDRQAFVLCYSDPNHPEYRTAVRQHFKDTVYHMEPLVRWVSLATLCKEDKIPLLPGDNLFKSKLLRGIEDAPSRREQLARIARSSFIGSTSLKSDSQLTTVLNKLVQKKYLVEIDRQGIQFRATGKWSILYDTIEFIELNAPDDQSLEDEQLRMGE